MKKRLKQKPGSPQEERGHVFIWSGDFRVYILQCRDGSYYTGHTHDLSSRLKLHREGKGAKYVRSRLPFRLVYSKEYRYFKQAFAEECRIKGLLRPDKEKLVKEYRRDQRIKRGG